MSSSQLIELFSSDGQQLLSEVASGTSNGCCYQSHLHRIFTKQIGNTTCGLVTCCHILSAFNTAASNDEAHALPRFTEENMYTYEQTNAVIALDQIRKKVLFPVQPCTYRYMCGLQDMSIATHLFQVPTQLQLCMTLDEVHDLLVAHGCRKVTKVNATDCTVERFRNDAIEALSRSDSSKAIVVNYHMGTLGQDLPFGHHSPVAAYHASTDRLLVLDTWRATVECWAEVGALHAAMITVDEETGKSRGYCVVEF